MSSNKIGPLLLSGLIIGPILGSGIIILPPKVYQVSGDDAIIAWLFILLLSLLYAILFGKLSMNYPGDSGMAVAVEKALGKHMKNLSAVFFILAICFGPIAVLTTAGEYFQSLFQQHLFNPKLFTLLAILISYIIVTRKISLIGQIAFSISTAIVVILLSGSLSMLFFHSTHYTIQTPFHLHAFGYSILLLFWALVGWETIGNYTMEVTDLRKTIPRAIMISFTLIALVSIAVALAYQWGDFHNRTEVGTVVSMSLLLQPLFGAWATKVMSLVTVALCITTAVLIVGAVTRLINDQAKAHVLPKFLIYRNENNVPMSAIISMFIIHLVVFVLTYINVLSLENILAIANAFFIGNALMGIIASFRIFKEWWIKGISVILAVCFLLILLFSSPWMIAIILMISSYYIGQQIREPSSIKGKVALRVEQSSKL